ncbi:MAG: hypothetical protein A2W99_16135 [Bacteroidetes bacterium GWF2_33_16]|nr:MAG: hypothetical protein A2X00_15480 [Bacteroidetes bacterium GWE2_32_14]OFY02431.1 MAG: hypothetical protein A2W99_16135 [Bacteroidetes bacterium GWF2_33_16]
MISKYSIAVLPFVNMSSDKENEYFSDGITEEIINALSKIESLHVTARTSSFTFKNQNIDIREIGKKLNVLLILEGSIRKSKNHVRITAQLVNTENGYHLWSDSWDRELKNIFILQDEIAAIIANRIITNVQTEITITSYVVKNTEALDLYLKGTYLFNKLDFREVENAINCFEKSLEIDSGLIRSNIGLCSCYMWLGASGMMNPQDAYQKMEYNINKVLALDKNMPEVYAVIAGKNFWMEWNLPLALKNINKALNLKPSFYDALIQKGMILVTLGNIEEALDSFFRAERINPFAPTINYLIGFVYSLTNENIKALEYINRNIQIGKYWYAQYLAKIEVFCKLKRFDDAWDVIVDLEKDPYNPLSIAELKAYYYASLNKKEETYEQIRIIENELQENLKKGNSTSFYSLSVIHLILGNNAKALDYLESGLEHRAAPFLFIKVENIWDEIRSNPRFINATKKIIFSSDNIITVDIVKKYRKSTLSKKQAALIQKEISTFMENEKLFLNPKLSLYDLAENINISTNQLSQLLNEYMGKNFYDFINTYRLEYFLKLINEPKYKKFTILALAYECGFNSKTTFNLFFKKSLGTTPSDYYKTKDL